MLAIVGSQYITCMCYITLKDFILTCLYHNGSGGLLVVGLRVCGLCGRWKVSEGRRRRKEEDVTDVDVDKKDVRRMI